MSREEIISAIDDLLVNTPEKGLLEVLTYLQLLQDNSNEYLAVAKNLKTILQEESELLHRLAQ